MSNTLRPNDLAFVVRRLPRDVRNALSEYHGRMFLAGGFIRASVAGETPADIDLFGDSASTLAVASEVMMAKRNEKQCQTRIHKSKNAITILSANDRLPVQFITRWTFANAADCAKSFDFTVCQAVVWQDASGKWCSECHPDFYADLAARRLVYTEPVREEEAGGSLMRAIKYIKRGYTIQVDSLGAVIARLADKVRDSSVDTKQVLVGLLREVDPLLALDGLEVIDDHEKPLEIAQ